MGNQDRKNERLIGENKSECQTFHLERCKMVPVPRSPDFVGDVLDSSNSETMSVGFYRNKFKGEKNEWIVTYDEALICTKGTLVIRSPEGTKTAKAGEVIFLTKGTQVAYESGEDDTQVVYVTYRIGWMCTDNPNTPDCSMIITRQRRVLRWLPAKELPEVDNHARDKALTQLITRPPALRSLVDTPRNLQAKLSPTSIGTSSYGSRSQGHRDQVATEITAPFRQRDSRPRLVHRSME